ncbi:recombinase family protein, partial [Micromonospora sp. NPDC048986]|uniref:recombinase family protein n=1 Tax=Micromonospora sp. NPDC048986 TaxID=3155644 RepID=UPI0033DCE302
MMFEDYLYARISEDEIGLEKGVTRQLGELRELSAARGGRIAGEWSDNDISATKMAPRPDYEALMAAVLAPNPTGVQRRILIVHTSRLWRNRTERAGGIDTLGAAKLIILPKNGPELDLRSAAGRMVAGMLGEADTGESETKAERIIDAAKERAEEGRANGDVLYGWTREYQHDSRGKVIGFEDVENPDEANVVRDIVERLLCGESLARITDDLNDRGVLPPRAGDRRKHRAKGNEDGTKWGKSSVRKLALRPANISLRIYHRGRPDECYLPAAWPKIVDPDDHDRVVALLTDPARQTHKDAARRHKVTHGIGECGPCGGMLRVTWRGSSQRAKNGERYGQKSLLYVCMDQGCVGRNQAAVDLKVDEWMIALLERDDILGLLDGDAAEQA